MAYLRGRTVKNSLLKNLSNITIAVFKSLVGQTLPMGYARVPPDVRYCSKSDHSRRDCEMTRSAITGRQSEPILDGVVTNWHRSR
jgi:hypothetical protein